MQKNILWGATPDEWTAAVAAGHTTSLLPVVCNPNLPISPQSTLSDYSKTPSVKGQNGVSGIARWSKYEATADDIARWSKDSDYGICLQTRYLRAIDIDIENADVVADILARIISRLGECTIRTRLNSSRVAVFFPVGGDLSKRIIRRDDGIIELLATGQQAIIAGTHKSGVRYETVWVSPAVDVPLEELDALWEDLGGTATASVAAPRTRSGAHITDSNVPILVEKGVVKGYAPNGDVYITCPFEAEHTSASGLSSTVYMPSGEGYPSGAFKCLHAHCAERKSEDFFRALGFFDFPEVVVETQSKDSVEKQAAMAVAFDRKKDGTIKAKLSNLIAAFRTRGYWDEVVAWDTFSDALMVKMDTDDAVWRPWLEEDYTRYRLDCESRGFDPVTRDLMRDAVDYVARCRKYDAAKLWLTSLPPWDGEPRVDSFIATYCSVNQSDYHRGVSRYLWTGLAGRVMQPGSKADMVIVLSGAEGLNKSSLIGALAAMPNTLVELDLSNKSADLSRTIKGALIGELNELNGLGTRDLEWFKAFASRTEELWVPKFKELTTRYPRRLMFIASTNNHEFLVDETGLRRWLPVAVGQCLYEEAKADALQLWAEGLHIWKEHKGIDWSVHHIADAARADHTVTDTLSASWKAIISCWVNKEDFTTGIAPVTAPISPTRLFVEALGYKPDDVKPWMGRRLTKVMQDLGYTRIRTRDGVLWSRL